MEIILRGIGVSPGIAIGPVLAFDFARYDVPKYTVTNIEAEQERLHRAVELTRDDLTLLYKKTVRELGETHADILNVHLMLLDDVAMREEVEIRLKEEQVNVEHILDELAKRYSKVIGALEDPRFQERTADLLDVIDRVLRNLLDAKRPNLKEMDEDSIVVAHELSPSDTATLNVQNTLGLALDSGSVTSHTAILARALEVPAVMGLKRVTGRTEPGSIMILDGTEGLVIIRPTEETLKRYQERRTRFHQEREKLQQNVFSGACRTLDGVAVPTYANIELPLEIPHSLKANAEGIGLYRTEYLFLNRNSLPSEEEQFEAYRHVAQEISPRPVTLRTIDIGGDKFVSHMQISKEENPQLGWRAVRFCLERPDIFKAQLRAMLRASTYGNVQIMFPMISGIEELRSVKKVLAEVQSELDEEDIPYNKDIQVGSMIEVPSAVALADLLAQECDFFSVGTNDLIQYSLAVDRVNEKIAHLYDPAHPAVVRMISVTAAAAQQYGIPCGICGEMAGDPLYTEMLLGLGINSFSMSALALPVIRAAISNMNMEEAKTLAARILKLPTAGEIKEVLRQRLREKGAITQYSSLLKTNDKKDS